MKKILTILVMFLIMISTATAITIDRVINDDTDTISYEIYGTAGLDAYGGLIYESMPAGYSLTNYVGEDYKIEDGYLKMFFSHASLPTYKLVGTEGVTMSGYFKMGDDCVGDVCTPGDSDLIGGDSDLNGGGNCIPITCAGQCGEIFDGCIAFINCGTCDVGYECVNNVCVLEQCVPDCTGKSCGDDDGCGTKCVVQDCPEGEICSSTGVCVDDVIDDYCATDDDCEFFQKCKDNVCELNLSIIILIGVGLFAMKMFSK